MEKVKLMLMEYVLDWDEEYIAIYPDRIVISNNKEVTRIIWKDIMRKYIIISDYARIEF